MFVGNVFNDAGADTGDIGHSLRFASSRSCYMSRTPGSASNRTTWTMSIWCKRAVIASNLGLFSQGVDVNNHTAARFNADGTLNIHHDDAGAGAWALTTTPVYRDPSAWYHLVFAVDTNQATASDRVKVYVNGVQVTAFATATYPTSAFQTDVNTTDAFRIGDNIGRSYFYDGYLSRVCFVDGQALTPSSFGYQNTEINEWVSKTQSQVKAVVDAGGTNSFMLDFDNGTSLTTLGYDKSSKGNNWTLNNFSLTAGTTYDWMLDVPGNSFATLNRIIPSAANITNGNLTSGTTAVRGTQNALLFDCKWEVTAGGSAVTAGVISATGTLNTTSVTANKTFAFRLTAAGALDYRNVTDVGAWTSITTGLTGEQYPYGVTQAANWNFGQAPLHASATYQSAAGGYFFDTTSNYKALCQANMPDSGTVVVSGSFTGNASADGPFVWMNGVPDTLTINSNAVTFGTHADKLATGFKLRTSSASYNAAGSNTWTATITSDLKNIFKYNNAQSN